MAAVQAVIGIAPSMAMLVTMLVNVLVFEKNRNCSGRPVVWTAMGPRP